MSAPADFKIVRELFALALLAFAAFGIVSLVSVDLGRSPNLGGPVGQTIAHSVGRLAGYQAYMAMLLVAWLALRVWSAAPLRTIIREIGGGAILIVAIATAGALWNLGDPRIGGEIGGKFGGQIGVEIATVLSASFNVAGGAIAVGLAIICGLALMLKRAPTELIAGLATRVRANPRREIIELTDTDRAYSPIALGPGDEYPNGADERPAPLKVKLLDLREIAAARDKRDRAAASKPRQKGAYKLPPQSLLDFPPATHTQVDEGQLERSARVLEQKLADFGVEGRVVEVQPGPVVTMYKFEPGSGIKVSQIVNLSDDLSMALRAAAVRIQAPVPGEAVVGIEVPNRKRERVYLREILEAEEFTAAQSQLTIALGKDIAGRPVAADLAKMPHLLIAGATGTGKSVSIHTMIASILFNATADDVRLILVDPKMLELSVYENIPHLLVPVVVDTQKAASVLLWATQEMENRYLQMRELGVRGIDGYNQALGSGTSIAQLKLAGQSVPASDDPNQPAVGAIAASVGRRDYRFDQSEPARANFAAGNVARGFANDSRFDRRRTFARRG